MYQQIAKIYLFPCTFVGFIERGDSSDYRWTDNSSSGEHYYYDSLDHTIAHVQAYFRGRETIIHPTENM
jgi:hypothetical protein